MDINNLGKKALRGALYGSAVKSAFDAWKSFTAGIVLFVLGIVLWRIFDSSNFLIVSGIGLISMFFAWIAWKATKRTMKYTKDLGSTKSEQQPPASPNI